MDEINAIINVLDGIQKLIEAREIDFMHLKRAISDAGLTLQNCAYCVRGMVESAGDYDAVHLTSCYKCGGTGFGIVNPWRDQEFVIWSGNLLNVLNATDEGGL